MKAKDELPEQENLETKENSNDCLTSCSISPTSKNGSEDDDEEKEYELDPEKPKLLIVLGLSLTLPLVLIEIFYEYGSSVLIDYILIALASPVQLILGRPFYVRFYMGLRKKRVFTISTLVILSTTVAYSYSVIAIITGQDIRFFEASASVLTIFTIGEYLESRVLRTTSESIKKLLTLKPKRAVVIRKGIINGKEEEEQEVTINADEIVVGDIVVVKPGETIATDGIVIAGESSVDESMITGESIPVDKEIGIKVIGGTVNKNGYLKFRAINVGSHTVLANIIEMVGRARTSKPSIQRIADRAARYFIPVVIGIALASSFYWLLAAQASVQFVVTVFATVLVVSCPCALGIATPMVVSLGVGKAANNGILIKGGEYLEKLATINTVVFDKTGTLTKGRPEVTDVIPNDDDGTNAVYNKSDILQLAYSAEIKSEHPIAQAIVRKASSEDISPFEVSQFNAITGQGVAAIYQGRKNIFVGSPGNKAKESSDSRRQHYYQIPARLQSKISELESEGKTVVGVFTEDKLAGVIAVADTLRDNARSIVDELKRSGKEVILMTGDNERTADAIAKKLGITSVMAQVFPQTKAQEIMKLQNQKRNVAMVGDGINDAPALTQAEVGIAMGSGTDVAQASGHVILLKSDLQDVVYAFKVGEYSLKKIKQNLAISFAYNSITIPIAAGLLYSLTNSLVLTPALAALGWIVSDSAVFGNSLLVRRFAVHKQNVIGINRS
ncbi:MAG: heavy metal translocating P-type ATPase [Nitrososphaeraceae archaeon]|nr:heavy metal translocating P-type ATPase [Nitrososphaeraceae archaeon]